MAIFLTEDVQKLFKNKHVVILGDSGKCSFCDSSSPPLGILLPFRDSPSDGCICFFLVQRSVYKDLILSLQGDRRLTFNELKRKGEASFCNDRLIYVSSMTNGKDFFEIREYTSDDGYYLVQYYFLTK